MHVPIFPMPMKEESVKPMADPNHTCKNCFNCQVERQRELKEKIRKDREAMDDCEKAGECFMNGCMLLLVCLELCSACDN